MNNVINVYRQLQLLCSFFIILSAMLSAEFELMWEDDGKHNLVRDLMIVNYWSNILNQKFPVTYNHLLQGGYFSMPSARMGEEGEIAFGYSHVPPYRNYNLRFQMTDRLEVSGNYRIFKGVEDPVLGKFGFGDFSDKGVNVKISLFRAEDSQFKLPGVAIGFEDFIGTSAFKAYYLVATQVFLEYNFELSLGYGAHRIRKWFGGLCWFPFRQSSYEYLQELAFVTEYDAIPYKDEIIEPHPKGRVKKSPINVGLKYRLWDSFDFSASYIRGHELALSISTYYNFGHTKGLIPKIADPLPYRAPVNQQPIGTWRPEDVMVQDFVCAMRAQGFDVREIQLGYDDDCRKTLRFRIINGFYREEHYIRERLNALLGALTPSDIERVIVVIDVDFVQIQEYHYELAYIYAYQNQEIGSYELSVLSPLCEVTPVEFYNFQVLYRNEKESWFFEILPKTHTLFGSSRGKFKYALGISANLNGFLDYDIYYTISLGYFFLTNMGCINDVDQLNPSQLINVRTDIVNYFKQKTITVDEAYLEKVWNWGGATYSRISLGLFEVEYGGISAEVLYYPVNSCWAVGAESAILRKRTTRGISFTGKVRKLDGFHVTYRKFIGAQYFFNVYYDWKRAGLEFKFSTGKFLANDYGIRSEVTRYFPSGLRLTFWYTYTNANDKINGQVYHDKGFYLSIPLDIFYNRSSRTRWGYGMSAWLRDSGVRAFTGGELYYLINEQRQ